MRKNTFFKAALLGSIFGLSVAPLHAQDTASSGEEIEEISVVGSQIKGAKVADTLPVSVVSSEDVELTGAFSGDELYRSIPQIGFSTFNDNNTSGGINGVRGDVNSMNLRGLGTGNTLALINGRRMVLHPGFQTELLVPVVSPNTNVLPTMGISRVEVLRDGAAAIYGADAVGGVINTVLQNNFEGLEVQGRIGAVDGTSREEYSLNMKAGFELNDGATHINIFGGYFHRNAVPSSERLASRSSDRRPLLEGTEWEGDTAFDNRSSSSPWGRFEADDSLDSLGDDDFHARPCSTVSDGAAFLDVGNGVCLTEGGGTSDLGRDLYYDHDNHRSLNSKIDRFNVFSMLTHEFDSGTEFYAEAAYYRSKTWREQANGSVLSSQRFYIPESNYYNPFGEDIEVRYWRPNDLGPRIGEVTGETYRVLAGLRGAWGDWDYDTAILYNKATKHDLTRNRYSLTKLQQQLALDTPDAYNPWLGDVRNGGTANSQTALDAVRIDVTRDGMTDLFLTDFKLSNASLFTLPAGEIGMAVGVEARNESFSDDRDDRLDGTITFTDMVTGEFVTTSDVLGSSPTPDTSGSRWVLSAFTEFAVPVISPDMEIPLVHSLDLQLAARYEKFDYSGSTVKPKVAASWVVTPGLMLRGAWSEGFRAPNLVQIFDEGIRRVNTREDYYSCLPDVINGIEDNLEGCSGVGVESVRSGSDKLKNENTTQWNIGAVFQPEFAPGLTVTVDYWKLKQNGLVGIFGDQNQLAYELLQLLRGETSDSVVRGAPDQDAIDRFAGTGLTAVGDIIEVHDPYLNLDNRTVAGIDIAVIQQIETDNWGDFTFKLNAAKLDRFDQNVGEFATTLQADLDTELSKLGIANPIDVGGVGDLVRENGRPKWRYTAGLNWRKDNYGAGLQGRYVGSFYETSATQDDTGEYWTVDSWFTVNANIHYTFQEGPLEDTRVRLGVTNLFNELPPLADESYGFFGSIHSAKGRFLYLDIKKSF
ncbi:TonB-dependent receptor [Kordiimonas sediminis]|uniref:TonB-dependent receptor n=1 Tax=Kordiimonas sediminis TaxID=1735581 RepID=A0A919E424_9PROT|nr:TonB-dependent receptor [Kordiimonas sediminis]GHF17646.1 TonB-dependent receptor [Kordiimonas sediminis]